MDRVICPFCTAEVLPDEEGKCPYCRSVIAEAHSAPIPQKDEGVVEAKPPERYGYSKLFKTLAYAKGGTYIFFALVMLVLAFWIVLPSHGWVQFTILGWIMFILSLIGAVVGISQIMGVSSYFVEVSESAIQVNGRGIKWKNIVKMESLKTSNDTATGEESAIRLTTVKGNVLTVSAMTDNFPYIKKFIEEHAVHRFDSTNWLESL